MQLALGLMPKLGFPSFRPSGLLPKFMSALPYLFFSWRVHGTLPQHSLLWGFRGNRGEAAHAALPDK
jgi:hypothetical protein